MKVTLIFKQIIFLLLKQKWLSNSIILKSKILKFTVLLLLCRWKKFWADKFINQI